MAAVRDYGSALVDHPDRLDEVDNVGVDETAYLAATALSGIRFATGIVALGGRPRLPASAPPRTPAGLTCRCTASTRTKSDAPSSRWPAT
jgi:hypothetical protein